MLYQIFSFVLEVVVGLLTATCLLRLYMQMQRIPMSGRSGNPFGPFIFALTDWLVLPLRRILPALGRWDTASLVGALLLQILQFGLLWLIGGAGTGVLAIGVMAVFGLLRLSLSGFIGMVVLYAILSWVPAQSMLSELLARMVGPLLAPIRRLVPLVGGVDLSPLVLLVLLQIAVFVLGGLQARVLLG